MKISIITACLNASRFIRRAVNSVLSQSHGNYEILVQDGGSTDGTLEALAPYAKRIKLVSEADSGIYDAWNKAVQRASGEWALFLGADDFLLNERVLADSCALLATLPDCVTMAYGNIALGSNGRPKTKMVTPLDVVYSAFLRGVGLPFAATFTRLPLLQHLLFDPSFRIAGDLDFTLRALRGDNIVHLPHFVTFMEHGGISDNPASAPLLYKERRRIIRTRVLPKATLIAEACLHYLHDENPSTPQKTPDKTQQPKPDTLNPNKAKTNEQIRLDAGGLQTNTPRSKTDSGA